MSDYALKRTENDNIYCLETTVEEFNPAIVLTQLKYYLVFMPLFF